MLSIGAALLIRSFLSLRQVNPGFEAHHALIMRMSLTGLQFDKPEAVTRVIREGVRQIRALPGVEVAATSCYVPLEDRLHGAFHIAGRPEGPASGGFTAHGGVEVACCAPDNRGRRFDSQPPGDVRLGRIRR